MADKTIDRMTEDTVALCRFYDRARNRFRAEGFHSGEQRDVRHYAAKWIAHLLRENAALKRQLRGLRADAAEDEFIIMCSSCGKVKDQDIWIVDAGNNELKISHAICPECFELNKEKSKREEEAKEAHDESTESNQNTRVNGKAEMHEGGTEAQDGTA